MKWGQGSPGAELTGARCQDLGWPSVSLGPPRLSGSPCTQAPELTGTILPAPPAPPAVQPSRAEFPAPAHTLSLHLNPAPPAPHTTQGARAGACGGLRLLALLPLAAWLAPRDPSVPSAPSSPAAPGAQPSGGCVQLTCSPHPAGRARGEGSMLLNCPLITCCWNRTRLDYK